MDSEWLAVPYECQNVANKLEDLAEAADIPRLSIMQPSKSLEEMQIKDCKRIILRNQSMEQALKEIEEMLN